MGGANDGEGLRRPLFPRLHLNGAEKRISRLSPRNKIGLYRQISLPAQGFNTGSLPFYHLPSPSISSTHGESSEKSMLWQHSSSHESSTWIGQKHHHSFNSSNVIDIEDHQQSNKYQKYEDCEIDSEGEDSRPSLHLQTVHVMDAEGIEFPNPTSHSVKSKFQDFDEENKCRSGHAFFGLEKTGVHWHQAYENNVHEKMGFHDGKLVETRKKHCASGVGSEACQKLSLGLYCEEEMKCGSFQAKGVCPADVVGVMGEKQFWDVRRSIVNQQKLFALQVFELHRLVKVQKLIAESPSILVEDGHSSGELSLEVPSMLLSDQNPLRPFIIETANVDHSQKLNNSFIEGTDEHMVLKLSLPCFNNDTTTGILDQHLKHGPSLTTTSRPLQMNLESSSWYFPPTGSQWLVPVISPSEGPIYKPFAAASGVAVVSQQHGFGIPLGNSPSLGQTYLPVYGIPVQGSATSTSPFERARGQALALFPMEPMYAQNYEASGQQSQVIKVVPHNCKSASASAAQIFQCIQEERKQDDQLDFGD